jgi:hypothetical protein
MTSLIRRFALVTCMLAIGAQASAQVELLSQSRSVEGSVWLTQWTFCCGGFGSPEVIATDGNTISAPDFGLFEEEISIDLASPINPTLGSVASVTQDSEIQTGHFSVQGNAAVAASYQSSSFEYVSRAECYFEVLFEVSTPTSFSLAGSLINTYTGTGFLTEEYLWGYDVGDVQHEQIASLQLSRDGVPYLSFSVAQDLIPGEGIAAVSEFGILEPGIYTLTVYASTNFGFFGADNTTMDMSSSFDIIFDLGATVPVEEMGVSQVKAMFR